MKCVSCSIDVSANFVAAISDNRCPACGQQLLDGAEYQKLFALRKQLVPLELGIDSNTLTKISAAIISKFDLWPKGVDGPGPAPALVEEEEGPDLPVEAPNNKIKPIVPKSAKQAENLVRERMPNLSFEEDGDDVDFAEYEESMSPEEEAALIKEFGLDKGDVATSMSIIDDKRVQADKDLLGMFDDQELTGSDEHSAYADRINRAKALSQTANKFGIKPVKPHSR